MLCYIRYLTICLFAALILSSCSSEEPTPVPANSERTVLVYIVSNNSLGSASRDYDDIDEMLAAARNGDIGNGRLLVYHAGTQEAPALKEITASGIEILKEYDTDTYSVESSRMSQVISDMKSIAPADDYGLVLWSHASGWLEDGMEPANEVSTLSFGLDRTKKMNVTTLSRTLDGAGFSFIYFDCCLMASVEVVYELRNVTDRIVGSVTELYAAGMPYDQNIKCFFQTPPDLIQAARNTFELYDSMSDPQYRWCTMSVINTAPLQRLSEATRSIYSSLPSAELPQGYSPQRYQTDSRVYLYDFADYVETMAEEYSVDAALVDEFRAALEATVAYEDATPLLFGSLPLTRHSGLSTYIITSEADSQTKNYNNLAWYADVASALIK